MRYSWFIIFLFLWSQFFAQVEKITVKKEKGIQAKPFVTLAGLKEGDVSLTKLCSDKKFKIGNNPNDFKVNFGIIHFLSDEKKTLTEWVNSTDSLNTQFVYFLLGPKSPPKVKAHIYNIKAVNSKGEELKLNDIIITITK